MPSSLASSLLPSARPTRIFGRKQARYTAPRILATVIAAACSSFVHAATLTWDAGSGDDFLWTTEANWSGDVLPGTADDVVFPLIAPNPGGLEEPGTLSITGVQAANSLSFQGSYTLGGGALSLTSGRIEVALGSVATVGSQLEGASGLTLGGSANSGRGVLRLTNNANTYTGTTTVSGGTLIIDDAGALGTDASTIVVSGSIVGGGNGGTLLLAGGYSSGVTLTRSLALTGGGPTNNPPNANVTISSGAALLSVGNNTVTGSITTGTGSVNTGIISTYGLLSLKNVSAAGVIAITSTRTTIGSIGTIGSTSITGVLAGTGVLDKIGGGTLLLEPSDASGFSGAVRVNQGGSIRISSGSALGTNQNTSTTSPVDLYGGILEVRSDSPAIGRNIYQNRSGGTTSQIFVDHAIGSSVINQTATFGVLNFSTILDSAVAMTFAGRNGYGMAFASNSRAVSVITGGFTFTNNLNGSLTFLDTFWDTTDALNPRTLTFGGTGETIVTGSILASGAAHNLTKTGNGILRLTGTGATYRGTTSVQAGTLAISDFRAINNSTGSATPLVFGATTTTGSLVVEGEAPNAADLTTGKVISLAGTTGGGAIYANQTGANPVVFTSTTPIAVTGVGTKTFTLGGTNTASNLLKAGVTDSSATGITFLVKTDPGTWALSGTNTNKGATIISGGTLQLNAGPTGSTILTDNTAVGFGLNTVTQTGGGTLELVGAAGMASNEVVGPLAITTGSSTVKVTPGAGGTASLTFASVGASQNVAAAVSASATISVASTAGLVPGMLVTGTGVTTNAYITGITSATTFTVSASQTLTSGTALSFGRALPYISNLNSGGTVNFVPETGGSVVIASVPASGLLNAYSYYKGSDFVFADGTANATLRAPLYDSDAGFNTVLDSGSLIGGSNNQITLSSGAAGTVTQASAVTIPTLKLGAGTMLTTNATLTVQTAPGSPGGILLSGGSAVINGSGSITSGAGGDLVIRTDLASDVLTLSVPTVSGMGGLTKTGAGTLVLTATNGHGGTTIINEGTIKLAGTGRLSAQSGVAIRQGAVLDLNGRSTSLTSTTSSISHLFGAGTITNSSTAPATLVLGSGGGVGTFSGIIEDGNGVMNVTKLAQGLMTWSGLNTYTGVTTIAPGSIGIIAIPNLADIGAASGIGKGRVEDNAGSLVFSGTSTAQAYGGISYTGSASIEIDRLFTFNGGADGGARIQANGANNATLIFKNFGALAFGTASAGQPQGLVLGGASSGDNRFNPQITDNDAAATSLYKADAGLWHLGNANNTYTGVTRIDGGMLGATDGSSLPSASNLTLNGGVLETAGSFTRTLGSGAGNVQWTPSGSGGFSAGIGKLTVDLGSNPTWGSTTGFLSGGSLILNSATALSEVELVSGFEITPAAQASFTATTTAGSATVTLSSGTTAGLAPGQVISGNSSIPAGATIAAITGATTFTLSSGAGVLAGTNTTTAAAGGYRAITVNDNASTYTDFATITGSVSGTGSLGKLGAGILQLFGNNTYEGSTTVAAGTLVVSKLGHTSNVGGASSVGLTTNANAVSSGVILGVGTSSVASLNYVGTGEVSDRYIQLNSTSGTTSILADGSGALVLTNLRNTGAGGNKILALRGSNALPNMVTNDLADNGGTLGLTHDTAGTWILTGNNSGMTGTVTFSGGAMGIGSDSAFGKGEINIHNTTLFAYGGDRTISSVVNHNGTGGNPIIFVGDYSITFDNPLWKNRATTANNMITNNLVPGNTLTIYSNIEGSPTGTNPRILTFNGTGDTVVTGVISSTTAIAQGVTYAGNGSLTLTGASTFLGPVAVTAGTLKVSSIADTGSAQPLGMATSAITLGAAGATGTLEYTGAGAADLSRSLTVTASGGGGVLKNSGGALLTLSGDISKSGTKLTFTGGAFNVTGSISGSVATNAELIVDNAVVQLSVANTYVGTTRVIGGGSLINNAASAIPSNTSLILGEAAANTGGSLDLRGYDATVAALASAGSGEQVIRNSAASGSNTLTVGGGGNFGGSIEDGVSAEVALVKSGSGTLALSGANSFTGSTTVLGGTLEVSGSLSGTVSVRISGGTLRLGASDILNDAASFELDGGIFETAGFSEGDETGFGLGFLSVLSGSTIDFGASTDSTLFFAGVGTHTPGTALQLINWNAGDRLLFSGSSSSFSSAFAQDEVMFNGLPGYETIQLDPGYFEIVAVPEPSTFGAAAAATALTLLGLRRRSRLRRPHGAR